jgi:hypothetical protein
MTWCAGWPLEYASTGEVLMGAARGSGELGDEFGAVVVDLAAFQLDAVLRSANTALQLGDTTVVDNIRRIVDGILTPPAPAGGRAAESI